MRTGSLVLPLVLWPLLLAAGSGRGAISGKVANPDGAIRVTATSLDTGEEFSSEADGSGEFALGSLPPGAYRVIVRNETSGPITNADLTAAKGLLSNRRT